MFQVRLSNRGTRCPTFYEAMQHNLYMVKHLHLWWMKLIKSATPNRKHFSQILIEDSISNNWYMQITKNITYNLWQWKNLSTTVNISSKKTKQNKITNVSIRRQFCNSYAGEGGGAGQLCDVSCNNDIIFPVQPLILQLQTFQRGDIWMQ